jgi:hypothetical protein
MRWHEWLDDGRLGAVWNGDLRNGCHSNRFLHLDVGRVRDSGPRRLHAALFGPHDEDGGPPRIRAGSKDQKGAHVVKNNAGTWFALIGGGLLIYFLAQSLSNAGGMVQSAINTGQVAQ